MQDKHHYPRRESLGRELIWLLLIFTLPTVVAVVAVHALIYLVRFACH